MKVAAVKAVEMGVERMVEELMEVVAKEAEVLKEATREEMINVRWMSTAPVEAAPSMRAAAGCVDNHRCVLGAQQHGCRVRIHITCEAPIGCASD